MGALLPGGPLQAMSLTLLTVSAPSIPPCTLRLTDPSFQKVTDGQNLAANHSHTSACFPRNR